VRKNGSVIRTITYTGFDLAERIVRNEITTDGLIQAEVSFKYDANRAMYKRVDGAAAQANNCSAADGIFCSRFEDSDSTPTSGAAKTTFYVGNVEFIREGITDKVKRTIGGYLVITNVQAQQPVYDYLLRDSLGSIDTIASETGALKSRQSFNAHGQRRNAATASVNNWSVLNLLAAAQFNTSTTNKGFTGHEQLDPVGLIHMRARLYDPELGRFLQADDYIEPDATQGLNRYSYVLNNPLTATDPTGNFSLRQAIGVVVGVVAAILSAGAATPFLSFAYAVGGGFASAYIATGSLKAGLWGAVSAAAFWGIGTAFSSSKIDLIQRAPGVEIVTSRVASGSAIAKVAAHAAAGGTLNRLQGGKFGHGFASAGFTQALSPAVGQIGEDGFGSILARTAASAAIGGTASKLSGGNFANGARTAAFQQLFNETVHGVLDRHMNRIPNYAEAKLHFQNGHGQAVSFPVSKLNLSGVTSDFLMETPAIKRALSFPDIREGDIYFIDYNGRTDNMPYVVPGEQFLTLGTITLKIEGALSRLESGWSFEGEVRAFHDTYDFNSDWSRPGRNIYTAAARFDHGPGTAFTLEPTGHMLMLAQWRDRN